MKKVSVAIIFMIIAALSFLAGGRYEKGQVNGLKPQVERKVLYYVDPMTPGFRSEKPGIAPCGMPLEPVYADSGYGQEATATGAGSQAPGTVKISPTRRQLIGVTVNPVEVKPMTYNLRLYGKVVTDETKIFRINASTDSWVRILSDITTGSMVGKNEILAEVLAPAFFNAQVTYLIALDNVDRIREQLGGQLRHQQADMADNQIRVSVQTLQNLGITDAQVEELANTREAQPLLQVRSPVDGVVLSRNLTLHQWFKAGEEFFSIADLGTMWVYADVYEDEAMYLRPGMEVRLLHAAMGKTFDAQVSQVLPLFDPVAKTLKVRLDVDNPQYDLRPDMFVDIELPITMPPSLHVTADAVIDSGTRKIVYVDIGNNTFEPRKVETGWRIGRRIEITGGLMSGEKVVLSGNFLIDSESRMKTAATDIDTATHKDPICGMYVDEKKAVMFEKTAEFADETYYFCNTRCKKAFEKEPEKYAKKIQEGNPTTMTRKDQSWLDMLKPVKGSLGTSASSTGVVDWDGSDAEESGASNKDWSGWGKFPGAEYLGLKKRVKRTPDQRHVMPETGSEATAEDIEETPETAPAPASDVHHPEMKIQMRELPASGEPEPPIN